jgi:PhnB protein
MIHTSLAPWLTVPDGHAAAAFYKAAFGVTEAYRLEAPDGALVLRLALDGAEFWISGGPPGGGDSAAAGDAAGAGGLPVSAGAHATDCIRLILTVADPDAVFINAMKAGAASVFPVGESHGWRLGRLIDPFGIHWEIGRPLM